MQWQIEINVEGSTVKFDPSPLNVKAGDFGSTGPDCGVSPSSLPLEEERWINRNRPTLLHGSSDRGEFQFTDTYSPAVAGTIDYICLLHCLVPSEPGKPVMSGEVGQIVVT